MEVGEPLRLHEVETFASAGLASLPTVRCPKGVVWYVEKVIYEGTSATSGGNTRARVYIDGRGPKYWIHEQDGPSANTLYWEDDHFKVWPGERIVLEWDEAQADTTLTIQVQGQVFPEEQ